MLNTLRRDLTFLALLGSLAVAGCGTTAKISTDSSALMHPPPAAATAPAAVVAATPDAAPATAPAETTVVTVTDGQEAAPEPSAAPAPLKDEASSAKDYVPEDYDPWEGFNQKMFSFNRGLDKHVLKPVAKGYDVVMPEPWQQMIGRAFDNLRFPARFVNNLLQRKWGGAGRELSRFLINTVAGVAGLWDPAKDFWGIEPSTADFGQTLGKWGVGAGPYLVLPFLPPMTIRDGIGSGVDGATSPLGWYVAPFFWDGFGMKMGDTVNDRAQNIELYQGFEESVVDMYSAVRNAYLRKREQKLKE